MTPKEFYDKVVLMRQAQIEWFKKHTPTALTRSKDLEKEIDAEIARVNNILNGRQTPVQGELFT